MARSVTYLDDRKSFQATISGLIEAEFADANPKLQALARLLVAENAAIRDSIDTLREELLAAHALADRDPLCPVFNRRAFMRELKREIARTERHDRSLSLLFIDLDKFKAINDTYGHEAGDQALIAMAQTLLKAVRQTDIVARIGGDEFAILLIETDLENAHKCASVLKERIAAEKLQVSASIGVSHWDKGLTADELMVRADQAMFAQKAKAKLAN